MDPIFEKDFQAVQHFPRNICLNRKSSNRLVQKIGFVSAKFVSKDFR
jgi:hypothetical protein